MTVPIYGLPMHPQGKRSGTSPTVQVTKTIRHTKHNSPPNPFTNQLANPIALLNEYIQRNIGILTQLETNNNKDKADARLQLLKNEIKLKIDATKHSAEK